IASVSRLSPRNSCRLNTPRGRSAATISWFGSRAGHSARTVSVLRSTSRLRESALTPGRSNSTTNVSPSRQASIGITAGRAGVPKTCWARRSSSRNGSVRINIIYLQSLSSVPGVGVADGATVAYAPSYRQGTKSRRMGRAARPWSRIVAWPGPFTTPSPGRTLEEPARADRRFDARHRWYTVSGLVCDIMTRDVLVARPETTFRELIRLIEDHHVHALPVVDEFGVELGALLFEVGKQG